MVHKIKVKLGEAEFEAEGTAEDVQSQYNQFLAALQHAQQKTASTDKKNGGEKTPAASLGDALWARIFDLRADGFVTLKVLPKGDNREADAFLLILYGYRRLKQEESVLATHLLRAAEYSSLSSYRPAHALAVHEPYVIRGGQKKGSTYTLNNQGIAKAEEIAAKIFE